MCGIFCLMLDRAGPEDLPAIRNALTGLLKLAERRGREASGLAALTVGGASLIKQPTSASDLIRSATFEDFLDEVDGLLRTGDQPAAFLGHARLVTNGKRAIHDNNQPFEAGRFVGVHNGIIVNAEALQADLHPEAPPPELDSLCIGEVIERLIRDGRTPEAANQEALATFEGIASYLLLDTEEPGVLAATNNGSLHSAEIRGGGGLLLSEQTMLREFDALSNAYRLDGASFKALEAGSALHWRLQASSEAAPEAPLQKQPSNRPAVVDLSGMKRPGDAELVRCTRCVLPETMPFIQFDADGVCNWCREKPIPALAPIESIEDRLEALRRRPAPNCLIAISGGRDSCYGLHVATKVLGLKPVAFTYDWGMVTDIARRNTSRLCAKLGVEHILVSADIDRKRENVRKNVEAWLRKPDLGTVPLFTAGDKQFYYYANKLKQDLGLDAIIFCENGRLEKTWFKAGFCGIDEGVRRLWNISLAEKLRLGAYYGSAFAANPALLNASLVDTFKAYIASYFLSHDYLQLFDYVDWQEEEVERVLRTEYDWEFAPDAETSWRIGDGTAPFYNYIYYTIAGFTEFDTFRSNQIRAGQIDRDTALARIAIENRPRFEAIREYLNLVGVNFDKAIRTIEAIPRLYSTRMHPSRAHP